LERERKEKVKRDTEKREKGRSQKKKEQEKENHEERKEKRENKRKRKETTQRELTAGDPTALNLTLPRNGLTPAADPSLLNDLSPPSLPRGRVLLLRGEDPPRERDLEVPTGNEEIPETGTVEEAEEAGQQEEEVDLVADPAPPLDDAPDANLSDLVLISKTRASHTTRACP